MRCITGCNREIDFELDDEFCSVCFAYYLENLNEIMPRTNTEESLKQSLNRILKYTKDEDDAS